MARAQIVPSPLQPRKTFRPEALAEMVESIRERGVIQPLIVREVAGKFELIAGERRWRASEEAGVATLPVIVRQASDREVLELALIENLQRADLSPIEEAEAYARLIHDFSLTQEEVARQVGKGRAVVANAVRLLTLPPQVRAWLGSGDLSVGHAKVLLGLDSAEEQTLAAEKIRKDNLTVRATERLVESMRAGPKRPARRRKGRIGGQRDRFRRPAEAPAATPGHARENFGKSGCRQDRDRLLFPGRPRTAVESFRVALGLIEDFAGRDDTSHIPNVTIANFAIEQFPEIPIKIYHYGR